MGLYYINKDTIDTKFMIKPNKKIGIVYCGKSHDYAKELDEIIKRYRGSGYCIESVLIDNNYTDKEKNLELRVFNNLGKCNYAFVFLTKDFLVREDGKDVYVSNPNVLIEYGFFRCLLDKNLIHCIIDFSYEEVKNGTYRNPSDMLEKYYEIIDSNNSKNMLENVFKNFLSLNSKDIVKLEYYTNDLISSLILNRKYKTDFKHIFTQKQLCMIEKYSIKYQLKEILNIWFKEKAMLNCKEQIIFIFERIILLQFFPEEILNIDDFLGIEECEENNYLKCCQCIINLIKDYTNYKRSRVPLKIEDAGFYLDIAVKLKKYWSIFEKSGSAPIIECVTKNYIGLSLLNFYRVSKRTDDENIDNLYEAKDNFIQVIEISENFLGDSTSMFRAFAGFNLARVIRNLGMNANTDYTKAITSRENLSQNLKNPEIFNLCFKLEEIYSKIEQYDYLFEIDKLEKNEFDKNIAELEKKLRHISETPASEISLYKTVEKLINEKF